MFISLYDKHASLLGLIGTNISYKNNYFLIKLKVCEPNFNHTHEIQNFVSRCTQICIKPFLIEEVLVLSNFAQTI